MPSSSKPSLSKENLLRRDRTVSILLAGLGTFAALGTLGLLVSTTGGAWMLGSFGASCVLLFGFSDGPFSTPKSVIGGHLLSSAVGLVFLHTLGFSWWALAAAAAAAAMLMMATDTVHPPAGSNPVIVFLALSDWSFIVLPTLLGACSLVLVSLVYRSAVRRWVQT